MSGLCGCVGSSDFDGNEFEESDRKLVMQIANESAEEIGRLCVSEEDDLSNFTGDIRAQVKELERRIEDCLSSESKSEVPRLSRKQ